MCDVKEMIAMKGALVYSTLSSTPSLQTEGEGNTDL
jgi:hypothetical protein